MKPNLIEGKTSDRDLHQAKEAIAEAKDSLAKTKASGHRIRGRVRWLEEQREENHFAAALEALILDGRGRPE